MGAIDDETSRAAGSRRREVCPPARTARVVRQVHLTDCETLPGNDLVGLPADGARLRSRRELVDDEFVMTGRRGDAIRTGGSAPPGADRDRRPSQVIHSRAEWRESPEGE